MTQSTRKAMFRRTRANSTPRLCHRRNFLDAPNEQSFLFLAGAEVPEQAVGIRHPVRSDEIGNYWFHSHERIPRNGAPANVLMFILPQEIVKILLDDRKTVE